MAVLITKKKLTTKNERMLYMKIKELVQAAHQNAISKGWWEEERTYSELITLTHSEVSEALEDVRNGHNPNEMWYEYKNWDGRILKSDIAKTHLYNPHTDVSTKEIGKPCGVPSELADICIRIFDIAGKYGWGEALEEAVEDFKDAEFEDWWISSSFSEKLSPIHLALSNSWESSKQDDEHLQITSLAGVIVMVDDICKRYKIDLEKAIAEKMAYNATRPQRHGGKVL